MPQYQKYQGNWTLAANTSLWAVLICLGLCVELFSGRAAFAQTQFRPVVTLLTQLPGPTATKDKQWLSQTLQVNRPIPDNQSSGINSDVTTTDYFNGSCQQLFGIEVDVTLIHQRPADLFVTLSTVSTDGLVILQTTTLFDGPTQAKGLSPQDANNLQLPGSFNATTLVGSSSCARWRLNISDLVAGNTGTLANWTLKRRIAFFPYAHDAGYYQGLLFGVSTEGKAVKPNAKDYFREVSRGKLIFTNAGVLGPVPFINWLNVSDPQHVGDVIHQIEDAGFNFQQFDKNGDNRITPDELEIVAVDNGSDASGANRSAGCVTLKKSSLNVCVNVALVTEQVDFWTLVHEMSHTFGTVDLYGAWSKECLSDHMTLMSCEPFVPDDKSIVYLDPWHRWKQNWVYPYDFGFFYGNLGDTGYYEVGDETWRDFYGLPSRPLILRNPAANSNEYFLFEYRGGRGYDQNVADWGLVVWHVKEDGNGGAYTGSDGKQPPGHSIYVVGPDNDVGGSKAWHASDGNFQLQWTDGTVLPYTFWVEESPHSSNSVVVHWSGVPINNQPPTLQIIHPQDNSSGPYGFSGSTIFLAAATDSRGSTNGLRFDWKNDVDGPMGSGSLIGYGFVTPGIRKVTVTVRDQYGATARKTITYTVTLSAPTATIWSPAQNTTYFRNQPVYLLGNGSTSTTFSLPCSSLNWTLDRLPWTMNGCSGTQGFNLTGPATFTLTVQDSYGQFATASVTVNFVDPPPNSPPIVTILAPPPGRLMGNVSVHIKGLVTDPAGGPVTYRWTVVDSRTNTETQISTASEFDWLPSSVVPINIGESIELRLYGTNRTGASTRISQQYFVDWPPR
jgi:M6 family metalloprotease-like protein